MLGRTIRLAIDYLKSLNLYDPSDNDTDQDRRNQISSTRVFLILFIISLTSLVGYASLSLQLTTVNIQNPSQSTFEYLYSIYPDSLICPCTHTSIQQNKFITAHISYHQYCSSIFIDDDFISSLSHLIPQMYYILDIRRMLSSQLQILASQCRLSKIAMNDALTAMASNQLFLPTMISRDTLNARVDIIINELKKDMITQENQTRAMLESFKQGNQLVSALSSNFIYSHLSDDTQVFAFIK